MQNKLSELFSILNNKNQYFYIVINANIDEDFLNQLFTMIPLETKYNIAYLWIEESILKDKTKISPIIRKYQEPILGEPCFIFLNIEEDNLSLFLKDFNISNEFYYMNNIKQRVNQSFKSPIFLKERKNHYR